MTPTLRGRRVRAAYDSRTDENRNAATVSSDVRHPSMVTSPYAGTMYPRLPTFAGFPSMASSPSSDTTASSRPAVGFTMRSR
jgi:hypothetical protein